MARPLQISDETILEALAAQPEATSTDLAETLGIGQSTAGKRLAALEAAGSVRRTPGGREAGRRVPDRWTSVAAVEPPAEETDGHETGPDDVAGEVTTGPAPGTGPDGGDLAPATPVPTKAGAIDAGASEPVAAKGVSDRLGRGQLGTLVRDYLAARPGEAFGPSAIGKALDRSQGAVSNSLATMAARGEVVLVGDKPRRYRIAQAD